MFGSTPAASTTGSTLGRSASFSFSQPPANKPFSGSSGGFSFGGSAADTSAPATSTTTTTGAAAPPAGGFSFGAKPATTTAAPATGGGGLFGSSSTTTQPQQPSTSLFSFGSSAPQQQQQNNAFQPFQSQPQSNQPGSASPFARHGYFQKERFNDLPDDARKLIEELDAHIATQTQLRDELKTKNFGSEIRKCAAEWHELDAALKSLSALLDTDSNQTTDVGRLLERDRATTSTLYAIISNAKEPRGAAGSSDGASFVEWLERFFAELAAEYRERIARYSSTVETIQHHLASLSSRETYTPQAIEDAIHAQHESFMALAAQVAALHAEVDALKKDYARWYKQVNKSVRDPFGSMGALAGSVPPAS